MSLSLENVSKSFKSENGEIEVLKDVNLEVSSGEFICIVGASGCGKTTLLNIVAGLDKCTNGTVKFNGKETDSPYTECAVVFQDPSLFPWLKVIDNIELGLKIQGIPKSERREKAAHFLEMVHLYDFKDYYIHQLSGGMKQRIAIARALSLESEILLLDEPFASVDTKTRDMLHKELLRLWMDTKKTIIFITHNIDEAVLLADRIIVMSARPATVKNVISVTIQRPRKIGTIELKIIKQIKGELEACAENKISHM